MEYSLSAARYFYVVGFMLFVAACFVPAIEFISPDPWGQNGQSAGGSALFWGWLEVLRGRPTWLANPIVLIAIVFIEDRQPRLALGTTTAALLCALTIFFNYALAKTDAESQQFLLLGAWLWLGSVGLVCLSAMSTLIQSRRAGGRDEPVVVGRPVLNSAEDLTAELR